MLLKSFQIYFVFYCLKMLLKSYQIYFVFYCLKMFHLFIIALQIPSAKKALSKPGSVGAPVDNVV